VPDTGGVFNQANLVVGDMDASLAFYRRLGIDVKPPDEWPPGSGYRHAAVEMPDGTLLEWDNVPMAEAWAPQWQGPRGVVLGFTFATGDEVDRIFADLVATGHRPLQEPYDALWGARYALVADPDGNAVGLMGPVGELPTSASPATD
jgi:uncharacterized glyoxalase superfamily protein PhnB